jgi:hypothetical protein
LFPYVAKFSLQFHLRICVHLSNSPTGANPGRTSQKAAPWSSSSLRFSQGNWAISMLRITIYFSVFDLVSLFWSARFWSGQRRFCRKSSSDFRIEKGRRLSAFHADRRQP